MKKYSIALISTIILFGGIWYTESLSAREISPKATSICCIGRWRSDAVCAVAQDEQRHLVFAGCRTSVCIIDVSDPDQPTKLSHFEHSAFALCDLYFDETSGRLYVAKGDLGIDIWDISDSETPKKCGGYDTPGYACGLSTRGDYAYIADGDAGVQVINVADPVNPRIVGNFEMACATNIVLSDSYAFVADLGLRILDISAPNRPKEISYVETPGVARDLHIEGCYAYVADDWCGVRIIDISDLTSPKEVGQVCTSGYAWDIQVAGSNLYIAACDGGLQVVDVSNPTEPQEVAVRMASQEALSVVATPQHAYVAQSASGLGIYAHEVTRGNTANERSTDNLAASY
ncbi:MAG: hypothetical protein JSV98_02835 [candidate division WOR-3 bacterium]|nr:MAG: hypothetical protein JSV98_02835 [candidate division WOR-3 bacterium]